MRRISILVFGFFLVILMVSCTQDEGISVPNHTIDEGSQLVLLLTDYTTDSLRSPVTYAIVSGKGVIVGQEYRFSPDFGDAGEYQVKLQARDSRGRERETSFTIVVEKVNRPPVVKIPDVVYDAYEPLKINLLDYSYDPDEDPVVFELSAGPAKLENDHLLIVDEEVSDGSYEVIIKARDNAGGETVASFSLIVERPTEEFVADIITFEAIAGRVFSIDLRELLENDAEPNASFSLIEGPGLIEAGSDYFWYPSANSKSSHHLVTVEADKNDNQKVLEFAIRVVPEETEPRILTVGGEEGQYETLAQALNSASNGDVILIYPGVYEGTFTVSRQVTIRGTDRDDVIIRSTDSQIATMYVRSVNGFVLENLTLISPGRTLQTSRASGQVINCQLIGGRAAVTYSSSSDDLLIKDSIISVVEERSGSLPSDRLYGIYAFGEGRLYCESSVIHLSGSGLLLSGDINFRVDNNIIHDNRLGISLSGRASGIISNNQIFDNIDIGVLVNSTGHVSVDRNEFGENANYGLALYLRMCTDCGCGGITFKGTVVGQDNVFHSLNAVCPTDHKWPDDFYTLAMELDQND